MILNIFTMQLAEVKLMVIIPRTESNLNIGYLNKFCKLINGYMKTGYR